MLKYLTAGESHGKLLCAILEGIPSGLQLSESDINKELGRRQGGYGRSGRMKLEKDSVEITSGLRKNKTTGSPLTLLIRNRSRSLLGKEIFLPRPGHADLAGAIKYGSEDIRDILERASARETAARVALGAVAKRLLEEFSTAIFSQVLQIGKAGMLNSPASRAWVKINLKKDQLRRLVTRIENSPVRCPQQRVSREMVKEIDRARRKGDSLGGIFEIIVSGLPVGLGSHVYWERRLDGRLARALMSIPGIKGVEVGIGFESACRCGSEMQDEIFYGKKNGFYRKTNRAGGIEGGVSNGEIVILRAAMKPIPTLKKPLRSVDLITKKTSRATVERADICAVPAAGVVGEAVTALEIARVFQEKFGGDSLREMKDNYRSYMKHSKQ